MAVEIQRDKIFKYTLIIGIVIQAIVGCASLVSIYSIGFTEAEFIQSFSVLDDHSIVHLIPAIQFLICAGILFLIGIDSKKIVIGIVWILSSLVCLLFSIDQLIHFARNIFIIFERNIMLETIPRDALMSLQSWQLIIILVVFMICFLLSYFILNLLPSSKSKWAFSFAILLLVISIMIHMSLHIGSNHYSITSYSLFLVIASQFEILGLTLITICLLSKFLPPHTDKIIEINP